MTDYMTANVINDLFRSLFALLDRAAYWLLGIMYEILFNVASADIFANETVQKFYGRVQMIIGVFMIFKLAVSIIQGIINPDTFTDKKSGFSNIVGRVVFALIMLIVLTPINIPGARTGFEININNNGLLFGTLYELQDRILANNTLGRLILGTNDGTTSGNTTTTQQEKLKKSANMFTSSILKGFVRINLKDTGTDETNPNHRVCSYIEQDVLDAYSSLEASPNQILSLINASCTGQNEGFFEKMAGIFERIFGGDRYVFAYIPVISTIVAALFIYILLGEIITIAIRTIKLAVLRLLAPIPIISYIDPKSEKDGAFGAWVKSLTSTYIELFLHLAVIYFVIFLIQDMIVNGLVINTTSGIIGVISAIFIWVGLFFFVKQAPKFIKDILGVKGTSANVGLAGLLGGTAMAVGGGGMRGFALGALQGTEAATQGYNQGKSVPLGAIWTQNSDLMAQMRTGNDKAHGGLRGAMMDYTDYQARERQAEEMGYGKRNLAMADHTAKYWQSELADRESRYDDAKLMLEQFKDTHRRDDDPTAYDAEYARLLAEVQARRQERDLAQVHYGKASKNKEKIEKYRSQLKVGPYARDTVETTYRSEETATHEADDQHVGHTHIDGDPARIENRDDNFESGAQPVNPYKD